MLYRKSDFNLTIDNCSNFNKSPKDQNNRITEYLETKGVAFWKCESSNFQLPMCRGLWSVTIMLHLWLLYGAINEAISLEKNCRFTYNLEIDSNKSLPGDPTSSIHSVLLFTVNLYF